MTSEPVITVEVDTEIGAAYVRLSDARIARTVEYSDEINVDLDDNRMVVGIELLDTSMSIPLDELADRFHIKASTLTRLVAALQPSSSHPAEVSGSATPSSSAVEYRTIGPSSTLGTVSASS